MTNWRKIRKEIESNDCIYVLAVSGGVDSMVMVDFFRRSNCEFVVVHFNHNIQAINAEMENHVRDYCHKNSINLFVGQGVNINYNAKFYMTGVESEARRQRFEYIDQVCKEVENDYGKSTLVVTGHHNNDQVETVLLNLFRGTALEKTFMKKMDGNRYKPFLEIPKEELEQTAINRNIFWIEDPTNTDNDPSRNWLRNEIIPQLMERRNIMKTIPLSIEKFQNNQDK